jgi:hypothetical protein
MRYSGKERLLRIIKSQYWHASGERGHHQHVEVDSKVPAGCGNGRGPQMLQVLY